MQEADDHNCHIVAPEAAHLTIGRQTSGHEIFADFLGLHPAADSTAHEIRHLLRSREEIENANLSGDFFSSPFFGKVQENLCFI